MGKTNNKKLEIPKEVYSLTEYDREQIFQQWAEEGEWIDIDDDDDDDDEEEGLSSKSSDHPDWQKVFAEFEAENPKEEISEKEEEQINLLRLTYFERENKDFNEEEFIEEFLSENSLNHIFFQLPTIKIKNPNSGVKEIRVAITSSLNEGSDLFMRKLNKKILDDVNEKE